MGIYTRQSRDPRGKPEGDKGKKMILSLPGFFSFSSFPGLTGESVREMSGSRPNMTEKKESEYDRKRKEFEDDKENTKHGLTICTQKATRFNKDSYRSH